MKLFNLVYVDLFRWKDGQRENLVEFESWEEVSFFSFVVGTFQVIFLDSLSRFFQRKKIEFVLYDCIVLLVLVVLGLDIREFNKVQVVEDLFFREERKKRDGIFQRAFKFRSSASFFVRLSFMGEGIGSFFLLFSLSVVSFLFMFFFFIKCLFQIDGEDFFEGSTYIICDFEMFILDFCFVVGGGSCELIFMLRLEISRSVWENVFFFFLEQIYGNMFYYVFLKERVFRYRRIMFDGNVFQILSRLRWLGESIKYGCRDSNVKFYGYLNLFFLSDDSY